MCVKQAQSIGVKPTSTIRELAGALVRFASVGTATTALYAVLYLLAVQVLPPHLANLAAMVISTIVSTEWHRGWTFRSPNSGLRTHLRAGLVTTVTYAMTSAGLLILTTLHPGADKTAQVAVLVAATTMAGLIRFAVLRHWVFAPVPADQQVPVRLGSSELDTRYRPGSDTLTRIH
jgi:putative flippase GtrA